MKKQRIFVDMDGTIAYWDIMASYDEVCSEGYFLKLEPVLNMINAVKHFIAEKYDVYILSAVIDEKRAEEKRKWLKKYLPEIKEENCVFPLCGDNKSEYVLENYMAENYLDDILLDDYSENLHNWHGIGIKVLNGINGTKGTWNGMKIHGYLSSKNIIAELKECL